MANPRKRVVHPRTRSYSHPEVETPTRDGCMTATKRNLWMSTVAQAAVFALLFQALVSAFGCPSDFSHASSLSISTGAPSTGALTLVICTKQGVKRVAALPGDERGGVPTTPHSDCTLCLSHICCPSALAPPGDVVVFAPATAGIAIALETQRSPSSTDVLSLRNRGPPSSLTA
jgi:hypothetical protein